jgi:phage shock protein C
MRERNDWNRPLYRSRDGMILGVCKGLADWRDVPVAWIRLLAIVLIFVTGFVVIPAYFVAALLMKPEPVVPFSDESDREFYESYVSSPRMAVHRLKRTYDNLDRRIRRIESIVTSRDFSWDDRLNE